MVILRLICCRAAGIQSGVGRVGGLSPDLAKMALSGYWVIAGVVDTISA
jgi:hypothetical protein